MYLFFDTETTGLPRRWNAPVTDVDNWPRLVQLAWIVCDAEGQTLVAKLHGITTVMAREQGLPLREVMEEFAGEIEQASLLVGHNISFDECIVGAEFERLHMLTPLFLKPKCCTMKTATRYCKLPAKRGFKAPKLSELHQVLFGEGIDNAHNAMADVEATARCFWELKKRGVI